MFFIDVTQKSQEFVYLIRRDIRLDLVVKLSNIIPVAQRQFQITCFSAVLNGCAIPDKCDGEGGFNFDAEVLFEVIRPLGKVRELLGRVLKITFIVNDPLHSKRPAHISHLVRQCILRAIPHCSNQIICRIPPGQWALRFLQAGAQQLFIQFRKIMRLRNWHPVVAPEIGRFRLDPTFLMGFRWRTKLALDPPLRANTNESCRLFPLLCPASVVRLTLLYIRAGENRKIQAWSAGGRMQRDL